MSRVESAERQASSYFRKTQLNASSKAAISPLLLGGQFTNPGKYDGTAPSRGLSTSQPVVPVLVCRIPLPETLV